MRRLLVVTSMLIACGRSEPLSPTPPEPQQLCQAVMGVPLVHELAVWPIGDCLDVTFSPGAEAHASRLHTALVTWAAAPGTWLCFNPPRPGERGGRAVHVTVEPLDGPSATLVTLTYEGHALTGSEVALDPGFELSDSAFLHTAGQALGFTRTDGVESVVNLSSLTDVLALTPADLQSVAAAYPACR